MKAHNLAWSLTALAPIVHASVLPYNPTRIFVSPNNTYAYIFQPTTSDQASLSTIDLSKSLQASKPDLTVVSSALPFLHGNDVAWPYTPTLEANGNISVVTGDCSQGAVGAQVWRFLPDAKSSTGAGSWSLYKAAGQSLTTTDAKEAGAQFLANSVSFSTTTSGEYQDGDVYVFGGMCPFANSTPDTWTSSASYSNLMLNFSPGSDEASFKNFDINVIPNGGPPIAQAGATLTSLSPIYALDSSGTEASQSQDFVLIGGHTENAFINMSQIAVFSLPQQSWTFVSVQQPSAGKTDLLVRRSSSQVTPRSGHTATLSEDGNSIIIYGGWVGDVNTPADPQLAILELGSGFGGDGDWVWTIPPQSGSGSPGAAGIYGHGAAMLPGGVMMISGGYEISSSSSNKLRRDTTSASQKTYLYNTTSRTWTTSWSPSSTYLKGAQKSSSSHHGSNSESIGLGVGLGLGAALLIIAIGVYFWYSRRLKQSELSEKDGDRARGTYSSDGSSIGQYEQPFYSDVGFDGRGGGGRYSERHWPVGGPPGGEYPRPPEMQHATGMSVSVPSPTRGLRPGFGGKSYKYQAAPGGGFDENRLSQSGRRIHTITENVEEEDEELARSQREENDMLTGAEQKLREVERVLNSDDPLDPFKDPEPNPLGSHPVSPFTSEEAANYMAIQRPSWLPSIIRKPVPGRDEAGASSSSNWVAYNPTPENPFADPAGRVSPIKSDERTSSTLSDASLSSITRTMSTRTGALLAAAAAAGRFAMNPNGSSSSSSGDDRSHTMSTTTTSTTNGRKSPFAFARSSTSGASTSRGESRNGGGNDADSFMTARSNFAQLQSEGEALLGGAPHFDPDDPYQRALASHAELHSSSYQQQSQQQQQQRPQILISTAHNNPSLNSPSTASPTATSATQRRPKQGWVGSLRRALNAVSGGERSFSLTGSRDRYVDDPSSSAAAASAMTAASSPTKEAGIEKPGPPRRAVSDGGGALLRSKRGAKDWSDLPWPTYALEFEDHEDFRDNANPISSPPGTFGRGGRKSDPTTSGGAAARQRRRRGRPDDDWGEPRSSLEARQAEEDWDVEGAAEKRDVQILFTVPKSRLRVVNDDMDRASLRSASDGAISRGNSLRKVQSLEESVRELRVRSEGEKSTGGLSTAEEVDEEEEVAGSEKVKTG